MIQNIMCDNNIISMFPYYGNELKFRFNLGTERRDLMIIAGKHLSNAVNCQLPVLVQELIFNELTLNELRNVCRITAPFYFVSDNDDDFENV